MTMFRRPEDNPFAAAAALPQQAGAAPMPPAMGAAPMPPAMAAHPQQAGAIPRTGMVSTPEILAPKPGAGEAGPEPVKQAIGKEELKKAREKLHRYMSSKKTLDQRIADDEEWWRLRHWTDLRLKYKVG